MNPVHCTGTLKSGKLAGKPCKKFFGELTAPYRVPCPRCGTWHEAKADLASLKPGDIYEWTDIRPARPYRQEYVVAGQPGGPSEPLPQTVSVRAVDLEAQAWMSETGRRRWAWVVREKGDATENGQQNQE